MAVLLRWLSTALIFAGIGLIVLALAAYGYGAVERHRAAQELAALQSEPMAASDGDPTAPTAGSDAPVSGEPRVLPKGEAPGPSSAPSGAFEPQPADAPELAPLQATSAPAAPAPPRTYAPAVRLRIPSVGIDARVVQVGIVNGEFEVPKFAVGHYRGTALPGEPGNGVYAGHVSSISSGNVFANLHRTTVGADVLLQTPHGVLRYVVTAVRVVPRTWMEALAPTPNATVTLIACTGQWDWQMRDYLERLIVRAELAEEPPEQRATP